MQRGKFARQRGLSLMEVALGMVSLGLLMAGALAAYRVHQHARAAQITAKNLDAIEEAIGTFVATQKRFPAPMGFALREGDEDYGRAGALAGGCPVPPTDGRICSYSDVEGKVLIGSIPFHDLNLPAEMTVDGYGRRFTYAVSQEMTVAGQLEPARQHVCVRLQDIDASGDVVTADCTGSNPPRALAIVSHGRDGHGAWTPQGRPYLPCSTGDDMAQEANCDNNRIFLQPTGRFAGNTAHFNDDIVSVDIANDSNYWKRDPGDPNNILNRPEQYVGIGINKPEAELDVAGNIKAERLRARELCRLQGNSVVDCFAPEKIAGNDPQMRCGELGYVSGIARGQVDCKGYRPVNCPTGTMLAGFDADGGPVCRDPLTPVGTCVPQTETVTEYCPSGQTGQITRTRQYQCPAAAWTAWSETSTCAGGGGSSSCVDECGNTRQNGDTWCTAGGVSLAMATSECQNGNIHYPPTMSGLGCDGGGTRVCP
jgi:hypothetical protein